MLETLMKLYVTSQLGQVHSPMPHLFGPAGTGKSSVCYQLADLVGKKLHIINVSRISPLELEGVQMPDKDHAKLTLLTATFWTQLRDGDILLLDEFLRGFPEVYNGLLDILTSREVGGFKLPNVFIIGASNSTVAYDTALEDRLLHLPVPDIRKKRGEVVALGNRIAEAIGLLPEMGISYEMNQMIEKEIKPMYEVLDQLTGKLTSGSGGKGRSARNLIGQAKLRHIETSSLRELIEMNNTRAIQQGKPQYVVLVSPMDLNSSSMKKYRKATPSLIGNQRLTEVQAHNLNVNLQLLSMEEARIEKEGITSDDIDIDDDGNLEFI